MKTLKDAYKNYFYVGAAINVNTLNTRETLIKEQFNSITCENEMKHSSVYLGEDKYDFTSADKIVDFAKANGMQLRGHTMVWHSQSNPIIFKDGDSYVSRDVLISRMKKHIKTYMEHFKGRVDAYDVVNEAIDDKHGLFLRRSPWSEIIGDDFIDIAFTAAAEADSGVKLFYNDYNETNPDKREKICRMISGMKERGVPISGFGLQSHYSMRDLKFDELRASFEDYGKLGIDLHVTELDMSCYGWAERDLRCDEPTAEMIEKLNEAYGKLFEVYREYKDILKSVTFWGTTDDRSWLNGFPVKGRRNWPLLFDKNCQPKEAFYKVTEF